MRGEGSRSRSFISHFVSGSRSRTRLWGRATVPQHAEERNLEFINIRKSIFAHRQSVRPSARSHTITTYNLQPIHHSGYFSHASLASFFLSVDCNIRTVVLEEQRLLRERRRTKIGS